ncbi:DNA-protecting protein DprA [Amnibacterium flavum]|uniref:DNA-protecting protein DprA n=1 Tax=Amnibacterium flavum TaxID=2173173 RepID=A0A2V1HZU8_9MICO|nr:DNA-protecting protein DprA [Amnibacterium flavum]
MLGLEEDTVRAAVAGVRRDSGTVASDDVGDIFARASWAGIAEPGDGTAGALISALGARRALAVMLEGVAADRIANEVLDRASIELRVDTIRSGLDRWRPRLVAGDALAALHRAAQRGVSLVLPGDLHWPSGLDDLGDHKPNVLWMLGDRSALTSLSASFAIVGARAATKYGEYVATEAAAGLSDRGFAIASGGAYGIDGMAHRATIASGGVTVAFLAGGVDRFYPSGHHSLLTEITKRGAVVSELPCGASPTRWRFLQRNRLIAAATQATIVVEAGRRSGSLNTAGHAATLGRPLGAVPGPITSVASDGCHRLLREFAAVCVTNADEMAELVTGEAPPTLFDLPGGDGAGVRVLDSLSKRSGRSIHDIAKRSGLAPAEVQGALGLLELEGLVVEAAGAWRRR